ncbi:MAG: hypothetical protein AB8B52_09655 [Winogradskyella sp.]|uniref:hypothetical protein n=1 Tax=Winogradskyella sp. TaxID=1883156 RepID=UPI00385BE92A
MKNSNKKQKTEHKTATSTPFFRFKKLYLILLLPLIVATTCEDDDINSGFETEYFIQNDSSIDLVLFTEGGGQLPVPSEGELRVSGDLNQDAEPISPSESFIFSNIKLYKMDNEDFVLAYEQSPLDDALWIFSETSENRFAYRLIITDALLD